MLETLDRGESMMSEETRGNLTIALWFLSALPLIALFIAAAVQGELTSGHLLLAFTLLALAVIGTTFLWRGHSTETEQDKSKRRRVETLLRDMSDDDLMELKQRLSDVDVNEETTAHSLGDDGELVRRSARRS
jgi:hypothetical protein